MILVKASMAGDWFPHSCLSIVRIKRKCLDVDGYYSLLGIDTGATEDEVKKAAKHLMLETHPDVGGDDERFRRLLTAYKTLSNPERRAEYDSMGNRQQTIMKVGTREQPPAPSRPCFFKGMKDILDENDMELVYRWQQMVMDAAHGFDMAMPVMVGISNEIDGYGIIDDIAMISPKTELSEGMAKAYVLYKMTKAKGETKC